MNKILVCVLFCASCFPLTKREIQLNKFDNEAVRITKHIEDITRVSNPTIKIKIVQSVLLDNNYVGVVHMMVVYENENITRNYFAIVKCDEGEDSCVLMGGAGVD